MSEPIRKILLDEKSIPTAWYNVQADMPNPVEPALHPGTLQPLGPADLTSIFPMELIKQEVSADRWIEIPDEVRELYKQWRPTPVYRATALEKLLDTPAKIYYKYEGTSPAGSHKLNTALPQAYYNKAAGIKRLATETGAGQWGSALSLACTFFGLECVVYMVKVSYNQKPYRKSFMEVYGAEVIPSPSMRTSSGRQVLEMNPDSPGSLGIAISEAVEDAVSREDTNYALGSVLNHVILHQTVIGQEAKAQLAMVDEYPDVVLGCCGGGSNFAGIAFPFLADRSQGKPVRLVAVEPDACPTLTKGVFAYDFGDLAKLTPVTKMYTLGHDFVPPGFHAGGLRYHGDSPLVSQLYHDGLIEAQAYGQTAIFEAALAFARSEGIIPAPESAHAIAGAIAEAKAAKEAGEARTILFCLSGHGIFDLGAYEAYLAGGLKDVPHSKEALAKSLNNLPKL
ncbi:TrpB-like pyridoxal phosphate-dependent enzyme [Heliobacterium gestii]|uniref:Tryptophan synthase beta chain n=1 Tax=Heliomicrobium gestii TaxID=2699 RepID=A0A845LF76_HELGE|nr:TrpB-like pyridoxal phosphate-dependent enzyme [Heliomicrobium gestii]MBM7867661.1 tryptophan synthase beta chain [Heliomicrobium gestii]MZP44054.1 TrpB-like pyridoxal phosphate-dependent enzyme [Heliomicrobium gestii]